MIRWIRRTQSAHLLARPTNQLKTTSRSLKVPQGGGRRGQAGKLFRKTVANICIFLPCRFSLHPFIFFLAASFHRFCCPFPFGQSHRKSFANNCVYRGVARQERGGERAGSALRTLCAGLGELSGLTRCVDICYTLFASGRGLPQKNALTKRGGGSVVSGGRCRRVESSRGDSQIASNINRAYVKCLKLS